MPIINIFYIFLTSLLTSIILIPPVSKLAVRIGGMDRPDERKVHTSETPRLGGIAIFCAFILAIILFCDVDRHIRGLLAGAIVIFLTGLIDDLVGLSPRHKLIGEVMAASTGVVVGNMVLSSLGNLFGMGEVQLGLFAIPFTIFSIVGVMNAINLIDGLDGLAGGVSAIACVFFGVISYKTGNHIVLPIAASLLGAILGFLKYNTFPAKIFMGDSGSLFLGYCMGFLSIMLVTQGQGVISPVTPLIALGVPILDTLVVMGNRLKKGERLFLPDKSHIHHRLMELGFGHRFTVILVYVLTYIFCFSALLVYRSEDYLLLAGLISAATFFYVALHIVSKTDIVHRSNTLRSNLPIWKTRTYRKIVVKCSYLIHFIKYLLIFIMMLAVFIPVNGIRETALVSGILLLIITILILAPLGWSNVFLPFVLYFCSTFIIYQIENFGRGTILFGMPLLMISNAFLICLMAAEGAKIFMRRRRSHGLLISTPFEYFILFIVISVPLLPSEFTGKYHLMTVAGKSVILFVAYKLIFMKPVKMNRKILVVTSLILLVFIVRYFWQI
jgi:UDP-GlcNAc:undecaprenyl-phosphate GlcNAc-1-phosphate transferase